MQAYHLLLVCMYISCSAYTNASTAEDPNPNTYAEFSRMSHAAKDNGESNRALRTHNPDREERMVSLASLENWHAKLMGKTFKQVNSLFNKGKFNPPTGMTVDQATDWTWSKTIAFFERMKKDNTTPESLKETLNIAQKEATMSAKALRKDPDYLMYNAFKTFWDNKSPGV